MICSCCGGVVSIVVCIEDLAVINKILVYLNVKFGVFVVVN